MKLTDLTALLDNPRWAHMASATFWSCDLDVWELPPPPGWKLSGEIWRGTLTLEKDWLPSAAHDVDLIAMCVSREVARLKRQHIVGVTLVMLNGVSPNRIFPLEWREGGFRVYRGGLLEWMKLTLRPEVERGA